MGFYLTMLTFAALTPLPAGFALGYLSSERRTRDSLLLAAFGATFLAGATLIWFAIKASPHADWTMWVLVAGFLFGAFGLGALGGLAARVFGMLGWIIGVAAALVGLWCAAIIMFAFVYAAAGGA